MPEGTSLLFEGERVLVAAHVRATDRTQIAFVSLNDARGGVPQVGPSKIVRFVTDFFLVGEALPFGLNGLTHLGNVHDLDFRCVVVVEFDGHCTALRHVEVEELFVLDNGEHDGWQDDSVADHMNHRVFEIVKEGGRNRPDLRGGNSAEIDEEVRVCAVFGPVFPEAPVAELVPHLVNSSLPGGVGVAKKFGQRNDRYLIVAFHPADLLCRVPDAEKGTHQYKVRPVVVPEQMAEFGTLPLALF